MEFLFMILYGLGYIIDQYQGKLDILENFHYKSAM